jgi:hypothetical protein
MTRRLPPLHAGYVAGLVLAALGVLMAVLS